MDLGERGIRIPGKRGRRGNCGQDGLYKRKIYFQLKKLQQNKIEILVNRQKERPQGVMKGHRKRKRKIIRLTQIWKQNKVSITCQ